MKKHNDFLHRLSQLLDNCITLPGGFKIGLDGFIGLIPGLGDFIGGTLSSIIIIKANQMGAPKSVLMRMVINMLIDTMVGSIPILGDVFDFIWKANQKNMLLLDKYQQNPQQTKRKSFIENAFVLLILLIMIGLVVMIIGWLISKIWLRLFP
ncbi:hypothetical protein LCGC14_1844670 [marine sediment metagenome]|uniref:DUF4112 domain-containing protein n=1 Tax=marine sediment metagenome TaxID=412755 RepID=A0A0F9GC28_9ZZZZ